MGSVTQQVPRVPMQASPRVERQVVAASTSKKAKQYRRRRDAVRMTANVDAPVQNTRAQKQKAASKAKTSAHPTAKGIRETTKAKTRISRLMQPTVYSGNKTRTEGEMAVESRATK